MLSSRNTTPNEYRRYAEGITNRIQSEDCLPGGSETAQWYCKTMGNRPDSVDKGHRSLATSAVSGPTRCVLVVACRIIGNNGPGTSHVLRGSEVYNRDLGNICRKLEMLEVVAGT